MTTLANRTAVMTGVSGERDRCLVRALLERGMNVAMVTHQMDRAREGIAALGELGARCIAVEGTVSDLNEAERAFAEAARRFGSVDLVLPKHGGPSVYREFEDVDAARVMREMENRVVGSFNMLKAALPYLRKSRAGRVIFLASGGALRGSASEGVEVSMAKGALVSLTFEAARRLAGSGVTVNCVALGHDGDATPMGRRPGIEDLTAAVCWLAGEEAGFMTGQVIDLCGGAHLG